MPFLLACCILFRIIFQLSENIQLESRADPEVADCSERTALFMASESGNVTLLHELLNHPLLPSTINKNSCFEPSPSWTRKRLNSGRALSSQDIERTNSHFRGNTPLLNVCLRGGGGGKSSNFTYIKACVLPVTKDEMGQINEQV